MTDVTDEDRRLLVELLELDDEQAERVAAGLAFTAEVASLAAHRQRAIAEVVAWLRQPRTGMGYVGRHMADAIERGEHLA